MEFTSPVVDFLHCDIYVCRNEQQTCLQLVTDHDELQSWQTKLFALIHDNTRGYIWNREPLVVSVNNTSKVPCVSGRMIHGDAVDDEWLAVWLLYRATEVFPELVISVRDGDGQFLLAEAAIHIPHWITPENSQNRIFIHQGRLHIVPLSQASSKNGNCNGNTQQIDITSALTAVVDPVAPTLASSAAERAAFARLEGYPQKQMQNIHRARCKLPIAIARSLAISPQLIAAATELFYGRDPLQIKKCQRMEMFAPESPHTSIFTTVTFNRVQYAKLQSQNIPAPAVFDLPSSDHPDYKACLLGMKVAMGFEILYFEGKRCSGEPLNSSSDGDQQLEDFLKRLDEMEYFADTNVGSKEYGQRYAYAKQHFQRISSTSDSLVALASRCLEENLGSTISIDGSDAVDDDDSWLTLHPAELDDMMRKAESVLENTSKEREDNTDSDAANLFAHESLQNVLNQFESFLTTDSGFEGADMTRTSVDESDDSRYVESSDEDVDVDANEIIHALMDAIGAAELDEETSTLSSSSRDGSKSTGHEGNHAISNAGTSRETVLSAAMNAMDLELESSNVSKSFARHGSAPDEAQDVDVDFNLVENIVESFRAQEGLPGPAGTLLGQFGIHLPRIEDDQESDEDPQSV